MRRLALLWVAFLPAVCCAGEITPEQLDFFEKKIRPVLSNTCYECHSAEKAKSKGGLKLDTRDAALKGGNTAPAVVPGDPEKSLLLQAMRGADADTAMPPKGPQLSAAIIADFTAWIKMGAPDPREGANQVAAIEQHFLKAKTHWAFQPVKTPAVPAVENNEYVRNPVDNFIVARIENEGHYLSPRADKRTLIRRATFDLHGLPPTTEEVAAFVNDAAPDAYAQLLERLLASPRYGERWGRHWLDVARYADTMGAIFGGDDGYMHAYTYRDYVIEAFNADKPYDRFILEQLAADALVDDKDTRILAAQGFLTLGRRKDRRVDDEVYDDRIDTISRGLLGLTVSCARCHDHKLEPISARDYYALYGVMRSSADPEVLPELMPVPVTPQYLNFIQERHIAVKTFVDTVAQEASETVDALRTNAGDYLVALLDGKNTATTTNNALIKDLIKPRGLHESIYNLYASRLKPWSEQHKPLMALWTEICALKEEERAAQIPALAQKHTAAAETNPHLAALLKAAQPKTLKDVADVYTRLFRDVHDACRAAAFETLPLAMAMDPNDVTRSQKELEGAINIRVAATVWDVTLTDPGLEGIRKTMAQPLSPMMSLPRYFRDYRIFTEEQTKTIDAVAKPWRDLEKHPGAPPRAMALLEGQIYNGKVFLRGHPGSPGPEAPRQYLEVLGGPNRVPFPKEKSGRLELAQLIASPENPLTARVMVNRVWGWHFGAGLVRTPSDFGLRGEAPTHPELLDYLASEFVRGGWSFKNLHRLIMQSATYQQSSLAPARIVKADPDNHLWMRMNGRTLEFEAFRDAQMAVSKRLAEKMGGRAVDITRTDKDAMRRTVYGLVDRKSLPSLFKNFDFPDPNFSTPGRSRTALTPQALFLLNSGFIIENARTLAAEVKAVAEKQPALAAQRLYELILQRGPQPQELERALAFLQAYPQNDTVHPEATDWLYGRGTFDVASNTIKNFTALVQYTGKAWQMPDKAMGNLALSADGGEPGKGADADVIRRWKAPLDGRIRISGELNHPAKDGDGIVARVIHNASKALGEWKTQNKGVSTGIENIEVKKGDTLDFIVSGGKDPNADRFQWAPTITMLTAQIPGMPNMPRRWDAKTDFMDIRQMPKPLTAWEELAQVLLLCNEFMYVD